ncbi:hypothetical protein [Polaribacter gochangensis]|uniref:hypothetical protein n=1 Tax=Polaribacter gochangensis TaxID=3252903 RepID=UPI003904AA15
MKKKILILLLLISSICLAQKETIELPEGKEEIEFSNNYITALFDVFLDKNGTVYVKDSLVNYNQLGNLAFKFVHEHPMHKYNVLAFLHIDVNTPYKFVDKVKVQLRQSYMRFFYRTGNINNLEQGIWYYGNLPTFLKREVDKVDSSKINLVSYKYSDYLNPELYESYLDNLYAKRFKKSDSVLNKMKYKKIEFLKNDSISINKVRISHNNVKRIYEEIKNEDICFVLYQPNLLYKDYIKNILVLREIGLLRKNNNKQNPFIFPISGSLQTVLDQEKIKF